MENFNLSKAQLNQGGSFHRVRLMTQKISGTMNLWSALSACEPTNVAKNKRFLVVWGRILNER